ncbi:hypothetical protein N9772_05240 [Bacteroidia bacterium]|nr:hypothetical protein [Bacteroidia bacterium]
MTKYNNLKTKIAITLPLVLAFTQVFSQSLSRISIGFERWLKPNLGVTPCKELIFQYNDPRDTMLYAPHERVANRTTIATDT